MYSLISAFDNNFGIGYKNGLPWRSCRDDMLHFKSVTSGKLLLCGYNTYLGLDLSSIVSMGRELLIMPRGLSCYDSSDIIDYINANNPNGKDVIIIGGSSVYDYFLRNNLVRKMYLTWVRSIFSCDVYFPYEHLLGVEVCDSSVYDSGNCSSLKFLDIFEGRGYRKLVHDKKVSLLQSWDNYIERVETRYFELYL